MFGWQLDLRTLGPEQCADCKAEPPILSLGPKH